MEVLGSALLSSSVEMLVKKLASSGFMKFASRAGVAKNMKKLKRMLNKTLLVLDHAEKRSLVMIWLSDFRDLAYDMEDLVDEFETDEALWRNSDVKSKSSKYTRKVRKLFNKFCPRTIKSNAEMAKKIEDVTNRLEELIKQKGDLNLREILGKSLPDQRIAETSLPEPRVYGREEEKAEIVQKLLKSCARVSVIPIQGIRGISKTTLAQCVYNDNRIMKFFDVRAWVCVSDYFDVFHIRKAILESSTSDVGDLNLLQEQLKKKVDGKKFLIVLDDVWNEDYEKWTRLRRPLKACAPGSMIIVTTRNQEVSRTVGTRSEDGSIFPYILNELPYEGCLSLFSQHALGMENFDAHQSLEDIGKKIAERCKRLITFGC